MAQGAQGESRDGEGTEQKRLDLRTRGPDSNRTALVAKRKDQNANARLRATCTKEQRATAGQDSGTRLLAAFRPTRDEWASFCGVEGQAGEPPGRAVQ